MANAQTRMAVAILEALEARTLMSVGDSYVAPVTPTSTVSEDPGWKFQLNPTGTPQVPGYDVSGWGSVSLPHTWDGAGKTQSPPRGDGWYVKTISVPASDAGKELYFQFEGAAIFTTLYVDGVQVGSHAGAFNTFDIDVTSQLSTGTNHVIAVHVNDVETANVIPTNNITTTQGGLYRDVSLIAVNKTHVALTEPVLAADPSGSSVGGSGVYFSNSTVTTASTSANITVKTALDDVDTSASFLSITSYLVDAGGIVRSQQTSTQSLSPGQTDVSVTQSSNVASPHLWDGRIDPYLYDLYVEVRDGSTNQLIDLSHKKVGIRSFSINASSGFYLDGQPYKLYGVDAHQDTGVTGINGGAAGWAQTDAQIQSSVNMILDVGATVIRTSHYPNNQAFYDYCDRMGLMVYTEFGLNMQNVTSATVGSAFMNNAEDQLTEMIRQNYDHPSVFAWGLYNEVGETATNDSAIATLNTLAKSLDNSGRYTGAGSDQGSANSAINTTPDIIGRHQYEGWYYNTPAQTGADLDSWHNANPTHPMGITEFGAGASAYQYTSNQVIPPANPNGDHFHPENTQSLILEEQWAEMSSRNYLWGDIVWQMFDQWASDENQGDTVGTNDKGLVTRDRVPKDSYYFFKANWNVPSRTWDNQKVLYISDHGWVDREGAASTMSVPVTVYSNIGAPTLTLNGVSQGTMTAKVLNGITIPDAYLMNVTLAAGANAIVTNETYNGQSYNNRTVWNYHATSLAGTSFARVDFRLASGTAAANGYVSDTGQPLSVAPVNGNYGWTTLSGTPASDTSGAYSRSAGSAPFNDARYQTGVLLPSTLEWQYALPNGVYDVHIVSADSSTSGMVNNMTINGVTLQNLQEATSNEFYTRVTVINGRLTVAAGPGAWAGRLAYIDINSVSNDTTAPVVSSVTVNGGAAQRSFIQSLSVQFSEPVTLGTTALTLALTGGATYGLTASNPSGDGVTYTLALSSGAALTILPDGVYNLNVDNTQVSHGTTTMAAAYSYSFHRLFGDMNGDRTVDAFDTLLFNMSKGTKSTDPNYNSLFDFDQDGDVDALDTLRFTQHLGKLLTY